MSQTKLKPDHCPVCGYAVDAATDMESLGPLRPSNRPEPDDLVICLNCGTLNRFSSDLQLVSATANDCLLLTIDQFVLMKKAQAHIRQRGPLP